jgi:glutamate dehydrogenase
MVQLKAYRDIARMTERAIMWLLNRMGTKLDINRDIATFEAGINALRKNFDAVLTPTLLAQVTQKTQAGIGEGLPKALAHDIAIMPLLASALDLIRIAKSEKADVATIARIYFEVGEHFHLDWLRVQAKNLPANDRWSIEARDGVTDNLYNAQAGLTVKILADMAGEGKKGKGAAKAGVVTEWVTTHGQQATALEPLFADLHKIGSIELPMLIIAEQKVRALYGG